MRRGRCSTSGSCESATWRAHGDSSALELELHRSRKDGGREGLGEFRGNKSIYLERLGSWRQLQKEVADFDFFERVMCFPGRSQQAPTAGRLLVYERLDVQKSSVTFMRTS